MSKRLRLDDVEWKEFKIEELFIIRDGYYNKKPPKTGYDEKLPFLGATAFNNGITEFYSEDTIVQWDKVGNKSTLNSTRRIFEGNCLAVVNNGSVGKVYYQPFRFTCSHDITPLYLKDYSLNKELAIFLVKCLERTGETFTYARKWRPKRIKTSKIFLPVYEDGKPNWQFMEDYIKQEQKEIAQKIIDYYEQKMLETAFDLVGLEDVEWKVIPLKSLFYFKRGNQNNMSSLTEGMIPLISAKKFDNGYKTFVEPNNKPLFEGDIITINNDGDGGVGIAYYQPHKMALDTHVTALFPKQKRTKHELLFLATAITKQRDKFSHGYSMNNNRIINQKIILPIDQNGTPHWEYMSQFMQKIGAEKLEKALEYIYIYIYI